MRKNKIVLHLTEKKDKINKNNNPNNATSKNKINYAKLKFNKNVLIQILKKTRLKKIVQSKIKLNNNNNNNNKIPLKINHFNHLSKALNENSKVVSKLNTNFKTIPGLEKFHNITLEKINDLISTSNDSNYDIKDNNNINNINQRLKTDNIKKTTIEKIKNKYIDINDINISKENILPYLNTKTNYNNDKNDINNNNNKKKRYLSLTKSRKNTINKESINNKKKVFMSKTSKNFATNKWLESIRDSIKRFDIMHRRSRVDRLIFVIENPEGCFEENLFDEKPGDKYIMLKTQMKKHKNKFEDIIREIKLNQKKSEYLMKKYNFDIISRKKEEF